MKWHFKNKFDFNFLVYFMCFWVHCAKNTTFDNTFDLFKDDYRCKELLELYYASSNHPAENVLDRPHRRIYRQTNCSRLVLYNEIKRDFGHSYESGTIYTIFLQICLKIKTKNTRH
jgi:hypothetical protein